MPDRTGSELLLLLVLLPLLLLLTTFTTFTTTTATTDHYYHCHRPARSEGESRDCLFRCSEALKKSREECSALLCTANTELLESKACVAENLGLAWPGANFAAPRRAVTPEMGTCQRGESGLAAHL